MPLEPLQHKWPRDPGPYPYCCTCGKTIKKPRFWLLFSDDMGCIIDPKTPHDNTGGLHPIGSECRKKYKNYVIEWEQNEEGVFSNPNLNTELPRSRIETNQG